MDPISIIGLVVNLAMAVGKLEHQAEVEGVRSAISEKVVVYRVAKGSARRMVRADIERMILPENARPAQRALVSARTRWEIDVSEALILGELK